MMKYLLTITLVISSLLPLSISFAGDGDFTVYLVRHGEKQLDSKNPALTKCGTKRASQLATTLEQANIEAVFSTSYKRTEQTAKPLADTLSLSVQPYSPRDLKTFAQQIKQQKQNVLIVGHSNTTPQLAGFISHQTVEPITEKEYQMLYQVDFRNGVPKLIVLKQPLTCP